MIFFLILCTSYFFSLGRAADCGGKIIVYNITVAQHGKGDFKTVQAAIDSIRSNNNQWVKIHIKPGLYIEKVHIPREKPCIILEGAGSPTTLISYGDFQKTGLSATFTSSPPNVIVSGITFKNSHNLGHEWTKRKVLPAVAARVYGEKSFFFKCSFLGVQDTLFDVMGRHYFKDCYIQGAIDFIFGAGQSFYESCVINATGRGTLTGFVTAQSRNSASDTGGFIFKGGSLIGTGKVNLGRPWGPYSRVIFYGTYFSSIITPNGWNAWNVVGQENKLTYGEVGCTGPGADTSKRVPWEKKLNPLQMEGEFSLASFINKDGWLENLPTIS
ncbi:probable pectinesterase 66 [Abrus precatorius]|uniref:Pectinesterase n=1 Tax=Abrus precatorius TaxID=3816 RepID=A0A8B8MMX9_ABRPR|nr:probable pectinesterase 66 [Abrus precatorius]